jgi:hypothetical protein
VYRKAEEYRQYRQELREYEQRISDLLRNCYTELDIPVKNQWRAFPYEDYYPNSIERRYYRMYMPIVDIAVGPFAVYEQMIHEYNYMMRYTELLINELIEYHTYNVRLIYGHYQSPTIETLTTHNENARCFFAIEIERGNVNPKHILGSLFNASSLGRLGIAVAWDAKRLETFLSIQQYLNFLREHKKDFFSTSNVLFVLKEQFEQAITKFLNRHTDVG